MLLFISLCFLIISILCGTHVYVTRKSSADIAVACLSALASISGGWSMVYTATRFFSMPSKIEFDTFFLHFSASFVNAATMEHIVFGNAWLLVYCIPGIAGFCLAKYLRKLPKESMLEKAAITEMDIP